MTSPYDAPVGAPCWVDLQTSDPEASKRFYSELFGWSADAPNEEFGGYFNFHLDGEMIAGGMSSANDDGMGDTWSVYLRVDDPDAVIEGTNASGGTVVVNPMPVGDLGVMGFVIDAGGAAIGFWKPGQHEGFGRIAEVGAPCWFELRSAQYAAALPFYEKVFGWSIDTMSDTPEFRYSTVSGDSKAEGSEFAGLMDAADMLPEGAPSHWAIYFGTADTDAAVARVVELGGTIVTPAVDSPYGRMANVTDVNGSHFSLVQVD